MDPFDELADEARAADAVRRRTQARWLRRQAAEDATLVGALVDCAESGSVLSVRSRSGRTYRGAVSSIGEDFVVVGYDTWVRIAAVVAVRLAGPTDVAGRGGAGAGVMGDRSSARRTRLTGALAELAADERPTVVVVPLDGEPVLRGELVGVGVDVLTLVLDGDGRTGRAPCVVAVDAVGEVVVV